jgi:hypothetical protein
MSGGVERDGIVFWEDGRCAQTSTIFHSALLLDAREGFNSVILSSEVRLHWYLMICGPFESTPVDTQNNIFRCVYAFLFDDHLTYLPGIFRYIYAFFIIVL